MSCVSLLLKESPAGMLLAGPVPCVCSQMLLQQLLLVLLDSFGIVTCRQLAFK
jgi:hypothetical protein